MSQSRQSAPQGPNKLQTFLRIDEGEGRRDQQQKKLQTPKT
jgi:hypothetical protein